MERYLIIKTRDELLRIKIGQILYFEADRNYTKLLLSNGIQRNSIHICNQYRKN